MRYLFFAIILFVLRIPVIFAQQCANQLFTFPLPYNTVPVSRIHTDTSTVLKIPVVVHVLHLRDKIGSINNPKEEQIRETLNYLTQSFRAIWPSYPDSASGGMDLRIEFVLATIDEKGRPSNGINRIDATVFPVYRQTGELFPDSVQKKTVWDINKYLNIWLTHKLPSREGYAAPPKPANYQGYYYEGIVMLAYSFKPGYPILVHEAGHYFGLDHTWSPAFGNNCPTNNNCQLDGDKICDTEPHPEQASCNLIGTLNPCTGFPYGNTLRNFMSYSLYTCWDRFTKDQRIVMRSTILVMRPGIPGNIATMIRPSLLKEFPQIEIMPNPNYGNFTIRFPSPLKERVIVSITDVMGRIVYSSWLQDPFQKEFRIRVMVSQKGLYWLSMKDGSGTFTSPVLLQ